jgi:hypothetical protein
MHHFLGLSNSKIDNKMLFVLQIRCCWSGDQQRKISRSMKVYFEFLEGNNLLNKEIASPAKAPVRNDGLFLQLEIVFAGTLL